MHAIPATSPEPPHPSRSRRTLRLALTGVAVGSILILGGCGAAEVAQQQVQQAADAVKESAAAQAEDLLDGALTTLPGAQLQVSDQNSAAFAELRTELEQVNAQAIDLLATPQNLSAAALEPLQQQLAALQASVQQRGAALTGISVDEQKAWADLAQSVQTTADQVGFLAGLLG